MTSSSSTSTSTSSEAHSEPPPNDNLTLTSPNFAGGEAQATIPARFTCDGADDWPALRWPSVPSGTAELSLFVMNLRPVSGRLFFDWAVSGLSPRLRDLQAGNLPAGAVVGANSFGKTAYKLCPTGSTETYVFALYATTKRAPQRTGFDAATVRRQILKSPSHVGFLIATYTRKG